MFREHGLFLTIAAVLGIGIVAACAFWWETFEGSFPLLNAPQFRTAVITVPLGGTGPFAGQGLNGGVTSGSPMAQQGVPDDETTREQSETLAASGVKFDFGFDCATQVDVSEMSSSRFRLLIAPTNGPRDWFMFHATGVAGKTLRFDIAPDSLQHGRGGNGDSVLAPWWTMNPVYTYSQDLNDPATYVAGPGSATPVKAFNGPMLPPTDGQKWNYVPGVWQSKSGDFSFVQRFTQDSAYIAMRVPCTPALNRRMFDQLRENANANAKVIQIATSTNGWPLLMAQIGASDSAVMKVNPTAVIYSAEFATDHDAMWMAWGAINYLAGDSPEAKAIRQKCNFLIIPMLDPDCTAVSQFQGFMGGFRPNWKPPETIAYANWFRAWVDGGNRLDVTFDCVNMQSREGAMTCMAAESGGGRGRACLVLNDLIDRDLTAAGYALNGGVRHAGLPGFRLSGWLSRYYGPISLFYWLNAQDPTQHLNLYQTQDLGRVFVQATAAFLASVDGMKLRAEVDGVRAKRAKQWAGPGSSTQPAGDAIQAEANVGGDGYVSWNAGRGQIQRVWRVPRPATSPSGN